MPHVIEVTVKGDHLEGLARPARSLGGIVEMIWNAVDAEASQVRVSLTQNELEGVASVEVADNGHGMTPTDAERDFETLGGSWKLHAERSKNGERLLHGRRGQGRWRALSVGSLVRWITVAEVDDARVKTTITAQRAALTQFNIEDPEATDEPVGTRVVIREILTLSLRAPCSLRTLAMSLRRVWLSTSNGIPTSRSAIAAPHSTPQSFRSTARRMTSRLRPMNTGPQRSRLSNGTRKSSASFSFVTRTG